MPIPQPAAIATGTDGTLLIGGVPYGTLTRWRLVISPTTQQYTLIADGRMQRFALQALGSAAEARLVPTPPPARIGRPRAAPRPPFRLTGTLVRIQPGAVTLAHATILPG